MYREAAFPIRQSWRIQKGEMPDGGEDGGVTTEGEAIDNRLKYEERKTATREGVAVYKQANRDKSPKVTYSVPAV